MQHTLPPVFTTIAITREVGSAPIHRQLYLAILDFLKKGVLKEGDQVPSSRLLAQTLSLSRSTVATVYKRLCEEGILEAKIGSGVYVAQSLRLGEKTQPKKQLSGFGAPASLPLSATVALPALSFKVQDPVPFAVIAPDSESLPGKEWTTVVARTSKSPWLHNGYCQPGGYKPYKEAVADYLRRSRSLHARGEQVIATSGIQQAIDLCASSLFKKGDRIAVEDPYFQPHLQLLEFRGLIPVPIPVNHEGIDIHALEAEKDIKGLLFTPTHQYPLGYISSQKNILEVLEWAKQHHAWIIEDDYDSELSYGKNPPPAASAFDDYGLCIYAGSFTKVIYPGFNMGYVVVPPSIIEIIEGAKLLTDRHASEVHQTILAEFIQGGGYDAHIRRLKRIYEKRRQAAVRAIGKYLSDFGRIEGENEGTHITFLFHFDVDDLAICRFLKEEGNIEARALSVCYRLPSCRAGLILGYAHFSENEIEGAFIKMAELLSLFFKKCRQISEIRLEVKNEKRNRTKQTKS